MHESDDPRGPPLVLSRLPGDDDYYQLGFREILGFNGTLLDNSNRKLAKLHNQITSSETGYRKKRRYLELTGILTQWFDTAVLDQISLILERCDDRRESSLEEEIKKYLAFIDCFLRLEGNAIRWETFNEINEYFNMKIAKKSLFKYRVEAQKLFIDKYGRKHVLTKLAKSSVLIMKRIACEFITKDCDLSLEEKTIIREGSLQIIDMFKIKQFIPRDLEIYAFSAYYLVKKGIAGDNGKYNFPVDDSSFRRSISNAVYNIKTKVIGNDPIEAVLDTSDEDKKNVHFPISSIAG
ncbi:MAG: hypothetical protein ACFFD4_34725 [Candidatus Odinarchaeota archaeon]